MRAIPVLLGLLAAGPAAAAGPAEWPYYGNDEGGSRHSPATQITRENVAQLEVAWSYRTGDMRTPGGPEVAFQLTPILVDDTLYLCSPFNKVIALDPETGREKWVFDPHIERDIRYANMYNCRGVAVWRDPRAPAGATCARRVFTATNDSRLIALDAEAGTRCPDFGTNGQVDLAFGVGPFWWPGEYQVTSAPTVVGDVVTVGSAVSDNGRTDSPSGVVRAYDVRTGALRWAWDPIPDEARATRPLAAPGESDYRAGTANAWAPFSADSERGLLFVPTGNTAPDYYGGRRRGSDRFASATVALRAKTGEVAWYFQTTHHDLWDFDVASQPTLLDLPLGGRRVPAVVQGTKGGYLFFLHRDTGTPLFPVEERPVPQSDVPGEVTSPTQPFPTKPPPLVSQELHPDDAYGLTFWDRGRCREWIEKLRFDGTYTPPSVRGTLMIPGNAGGINWGGVAIDPGRSLLVVNVSDLPWVVTLIPRAEFEAVKAANPGIEISPQRGTPFGVRRELLMSPLGLPCNPPPWGELIAVDLTDARIRWRVPLGSPRDILPIPVPIEFGLPSIGGPITTASGLVFIGAAVDDYLRAFDVETGAELWRGRLPAGGQATPMTYVRNGKQYVVIAAGGHSKAGTTPGDHLVAFALP